MKEKNPLTVNQLIDYGVKILHSYHKVDAHIDAELLALYVLGYTKLDRILNGNQQVKDQHITQYKRYINQRCQGTPLQYITQEQEFMGLSFYVDHNVLIPRQDTEILVETLIKESRHTPFKNIIEIGVGSGCISISLAKFLPDAYITGIDVSKNALQIAILNAKKNGVQERILWEYGNLLNDYRGGKNIDLIVSNPPYIPTEDCNDLAEEVKKHEPMLALNGGTDGLDFYRAITVQAKNYLNTNGMLAYEIGYNQGQEVVNLLKENGFVKIELIKDLAGKDRVVIGRLE